MGIDSAIDSFAKGEWRVNFPKLKGTPITQGARNIYDEAVKGLKGEIPDYRDPDTAYANALAAFMDDRETYGSQLARELTKQGKSISAHPYTPDTDALYTSVEPLVSALDTAFRTIPVKNDAELNARRYISKALQVGLNGKVVHTTDGRTVTPYEQMMNMIHRYPETMGIFDKFIDENGLRKELNAAMALSESQSNDIKALEKERTPTVTVSPAERAAMAKKRVPVAEKYKDVEGVFPTVDKEGRSYGRLTREQVEALKAAEAAGEEVPQADIPAPVSEPTNYTTAANGILGDAMNSLGLGDKFARLFGDKASTGKGRSGAAAVDYTGGLLDGFKGRTSAETSAETPAPVAAASAGASPAKVATSAEEGPIDMEDDSGDEDISDEDLARMFGVSEEEEYPPVPEPVAETPKAEKKTLTEDELTEDEKLRLKSAMETSGASKEWVLGALYRARQRAAKEAAESKETETPKAETPKKTKTETPSKAKKETSDKKGVTLDSFGEKGKGEKAEEKKGGEKKDEEKKPKAQMSLDSFITKSYNIDRRIDAMHMCNRHPERTEQFLKGHQTGLDEYSNEGRVYSDDEVMSLANVYGVEPPDPKNKAAMDDFKRKVIKMYEDECSQYPTYEEFYGIEDHRDDEQYLSPAERGVSDSVRW